MEALVLVIAELIFAPAIAAATVIAELLATLISAVLEFLFGWAGTVSFAKSEKISAAGTAALSATPRLVFRRLRNVLLIAAALIFITLILANYVFLKDIVRWATGRIEANSGISVRYDAFEGDLLTGRFDFSNLHVVRDSNPYLNFDLSVKALKIDMRLLNNPFSEVHLNSVKMQGISGNVRRIKPSQTYRERKTFVIDNLGISDARLEYTDSTDSQRQQHIILAVNDWSSSPMHSRLALFDLLFRSNAHGTLNGHEFTIETAGDQTHRTTSWRISELPVDSIHGFVGGPFELLQSGTVDVQVDDQWELSGSPDISFNWHFIFRNLKTGVPEDYRGLQRKFAQHVSDYLNSRPPQFDLGFAMIMNRDVFRGKTTLAAAGLWRVMRDAMAEELGKLTGHSQQEIKSEISRGIGALRRYLDDKRKNKPDD